MEQRVSLVTLGVTDLIRARRFYEALGWSGGRQPDDDVCFFQAGGMVFGLWTALGGHGAPGIELAYNVRSPGEVNSVSLIPSEPVGLSCDPPLRRRGEERQGRSPILTATSGRLLTTWSGPSTLADLSRSDVRTSHRVNSPSLRDYIEGDSGAEGPESDVVDPVPCELTGGTIGPLDQPGSTTTPGARATSVGLNGDGTDVEGSEAVDIDPRSSPGWARCVKRHPRFSRRRGATAADVSEPPRHHHRRPPRHRQRRRGGAP